MLADVCREFPLPVFAVLGNHDWHSDRDDEIDGAARVGRGHACSTAARRLAVGRASRSGSSASRASWAASRRPDGDFGEPLVRACYAEVTQEVEALNRGLRGGRRRPDPDRAAPLRPIAETLAGEPRGHLGVPRLRAAGGADRRSTGPTSSSTATPTAARFEGCIGDGAGLQRRGARDRPRLLGVRARGEGARRRAPGRGRGRGAGVAS